MPIKRGAGVVDYTSFTEGAIGSLATQKRVYPEGTVRPATGEKSLRVGFKGLVTGERQSFPDDNRADQAVAFLEERARFFKAILFAAQFEQTAPSIRDSRSMVFDV